MTVTAPALTRASVSRRRAPRTLAYSLVIVVAVLVLAIALSLAIGARDIPLPTVWAALTHYDATDPLQQLVREGRATRTLIGVMAGASLALAGALAQTVTRNPLADPGLLGINAGAALAVVLGLTTLGAATFTAQLWLAFAGAGIAAAAVLLIGGRGASSPVRLALAGAALTAVITSVTSGLLLAQPQALGQFRFWLAGSLEGRSEVPLAPLAAVWVVALAITVATLRPLSALALGDDAAASLGTRAWRTRALVMTAVAMLAGLATALAGPIAFVGLAVPHLVRAVTKARLGWLLALSAPAGAALVLLCDVLGRIVARPGEIPVGVTTALFGGAMLALMARRLTVVAL